VQVALELAALLVGRLDETRPGGAQILARLGAGDGQRHELAEVGETRLRLRRELGRAADRDRSPEDPGDHDRSRDGRPVPELQHGVGDLAAAFGPVVDPGGSAGSKHEPGRRVLDRRHAGAEGEDLVLPAAVTGDDRGRIVAFVPQHGTGVDLEHPRALLRDGREDLLRARLRRDERGDAAERPLLLREPADLRELRLDIAGECALVAPGPVGEIEPRRDEIAAFAVLPDDELVRPRDETPAAFLRQPVADLRAREARFPDVREHVAEGLGLLGWDHPVAGILAKDLVAREAGRALAALVEEQDATVAVEHAHEGERRLRRELEERRPAAFLVHRRRGYVTSRRRRTTALTSTNRAR
jgi:hypothetical protein